MIKDFEVRSFTITPSKERISIPFKFDIDEAMSNLVSVFADAPFTGIITWSYERDLPIEIRSISVMPVTRSLRGIRYEDIPRIRWSYEVIEID